VFESPRRHQPVSAFAQFPAPSGDFAENPAKPRVRAASRGLGDGSAERNGPNLSLCLRSQKSSPHTGLCVGSECSCLKPGVQSGQNSPGVERSERDEGGADTGPCPHRFLMGVDLESLGQGLNEGWLVAPDEGEVCVQQLCETEAWRLPAFKEVPDQIRA
jgi:hypothetical protein